MLRFQTTQAFGGCRSRFRAISRFCSLRPSLKTKVKSALLGLGLIGLALGASACAEDVEDDLAESLLIGAAELGSDWIEREPQTIDYEGGGKEFNEACPITGRASRYFSNQDRGVLLLQSVYVLDSEDWTVCTGYLVADRMLSTLPLPSCGDSASAYSRSPLASDLRDAAIIATRGPNLMTILQFVDLDRQETALDIVSRACLKLEATSSSSTP